jgi:hypothetical protein
MIVIHGQIGGQIRVEGLGFGHQPEDCIASGVGRDLPLDFLDPDAQRAVLGDLHGLIGHNDPAVGMACEFKHGISSSTLVVFYGHSREHRSRLFCPRLSRITAPAD